MTTTAMFDSALRGEVTALHGSGGQRWRLPVQRWSREPDAADEAVLAACTGPTLDLGCGPGRLVGALTERGVPSLGVDESPVAVAMTRGRGAAALRRDLFSTLPGEGRWQTALLADGNVGIGGDPVALLHRVHRLLCADGLLIVELDPPGTGMRSGNVRMNGTGAWFRWAWVGVDALAELAVETRFTVAHVAERSGRWFAELRSTS
ncbi:SAM-dependent methyltransferase [Saccharopolyspora sp. NPDC002578]